MKKILSGQLLINGKDIWREYGVFLVENKSGGMDNINSILKPSRNKKNVAVILREETGEKFSKVLTPRSEARDVSLHFALYAKSRKLWMQKYMLFIAMLKEGTNGWLTLSFPSLELEMKVIYKECTRFKAITHIWQEGVHAGKFIIKFREPKPIV